MDIDPGEISPNSGDSVKRRSMSKKSRLKNRKTSKAKQCRTPDINLNSVHSVNKRAQASKSKDGSSSSSSTLKKRNPERSRKVVVASKPKQNLNTPSRIVEAEDQNAGAIKTGYPNVGQGSSRKRTFSRISEEMTNEMGRFQRRHMSFNKDEDVEPEKSFWNCDEIKPKYYLGGFHCKDPVFKELTCNLCYYNSFSRGAMKKHVQECHEEEDEVDASASPADGNLEADDDPKVTFHENNASEISREVKHQDDDGDKGSAKCKIIYPVNKEDLSDNDGLGKDIQTSGKDEIGFQALNENAGPFTIVDAFQFTDATTEKEKAQEDILVLNCDQHVVKNVKDLGNVRSNPFTPAPNLSFDDETLAQMTKQNEIDMEEQGEGQRDHADTKEFASSVKAHQVSCVKGDEEEDLEGGGHFDWLTDTVALNFENTEESITTREEQDCSANNFAENFHAGKDEDLRDCLDCLSDLLTLNLSNTLETNSGLDQDPHPRNSNHNNDVEIHIKDAQSLENPTSLRQDHTTPQAAHLDFIPKVGNENNSAQNGLSHNNVTFLDNDRNFENADIFEQSFDNHVDVNQTYGEIFNLVDSDNPNCFVERLNSAYETVDSIIYQSPSSLDTLRFRDLFFGSSRNQNYQNYLDDPNVGENQSGTDPPKENDSLSGHPDVELLENPPDPNRNDGSGASSSSKSSSSYYSAFHDSFLDGLEEGEKQNDSDVQTEEPPLSAEEELARLRALNLILKFNPQTGLYESFRAIDLPANNVVDGDTN